jgi:hypothetical protein
VEQEAEHFVHVRQQLVQEAAVALTHQEFRLGFGDLGNKLTSRQIMVSLLCSFFYSYFLYAV